MANQIFQIFKFSKILLLFKYIDRFMIKVQTFSWRKITYLITTMIGAPPLPSGTCSHTPYSNTPSFDFDREQQETQNTKHNKSRQPPRYLTVTTPSTHTRQHYTRSLLPTHYWFSMADEILHVQWLGQHICWLHRLLNKTSTLVSWIWNIWSRAFLIIIHFSYYRAVVEVRIKGFRSGMPL